MEMKMNDLRKELKKIVEIMEFCGNMCFGIPLKNKNCCQYKKIFKMSCFSSSLSEIIAQDVKT